MGWPNRMLIQSKPQAVTHKVINRGDLKIVFACAQVIYDFFSLFYFVYVYVLARTSMLGIACAKD